MTSAVAYRSITGAAGASRGDSPVAFGGRPLETERASYDRRCQRTRQTAAQLRTPVRFDRVDQPLGLLLDERRETPLHFVAAELTGERVTVTTVLGTVAREHAWANDLPCREPGIVDREGRRVAHRPQCEIAPSDEPAPQRR